MTTSSSTDTFASLVDTGKSAFQHYVAALPIADEFKMYIADEQFMAKNPMMYLVYPQLFDELFAVNNPTQMKHLCIAGYLYYRSVIENDATLDTNEILSNKHMFTVVSSVAQEESIKLLTYLFGLDSPFWQAWNRRKAEYMKALRMEKTHRSFISCKSVVTSDHEKQHLQGDISLADFERLSDYKAAFGKVAIDAVFLLSGSSDNRAYERLLQSHALFSAGFQILDDLHDFQQDIIHPQLNIAHTYLKTYCQQIGISLPENDIHLANKYLYVSGVAVELLTLAISYFDRAARQIDGLPVPLWQQVIAEKSLEASRIIRQVTVYDRLVDIRVSLKSKPYRFPGFSVPLQTPTNLCHELANEALRHILAEWQTDFGEVKHIMHLSQDEGFGADEEYHVGDVFQRALITDVLCDVNSFFDGNLQFVIDNEVDYLLNRRLPTGVGGWSYFPSVPEIAPDADDLGQMIQVLMKARGVSDTLMHVREPLTTLLTDNYLPDGSFETWIVPREQRSPVQEKQNLFNETKWGKGPDTEVVANLLQGLYLIDRKPYRTNLEAGITYLADRQNPDGSWSSRWYYGPYYGTYVSLRLLTSPGVRPDTAVLNRAYGFLANQQQADGGWGFYDRGSDPLSTALALISLSFGKPTSDQVQRLKRGLDYLSASRLATGHWDGTRFIAPKLNEPYSSSTLTSVYVLKAAVSCFRHLR